MRTKKIITEAFVHLLETVSFDHITTQMILDESGVSRSTFYRHFSDKFNVMTWYYQSKVESLLSKYDYHDYRLFLIDFCCFVQSNYSYFARVIKTTGDNSFFPFLSSYSTDYYENWYKKALHLECLSPIDNYQIMIIVEGSNAALKQYILTGCKESAEEMANCILEMLPEKLRHIQ